MQPAIIVLKKNVRTLKQWSNILGSTGFMRGNPLFIIDDEADAASLNTMVNRNSRSSINRYLDDIKARSACSIYLQVTGTPQALLLQTMSSGWHPYFAYYFRPGNGYLGGDFFFPAEGAGECISYIDSLRDPLEEALMHHLVVSGIMLTAGKGVANFLIHPSVRKAVHGKYQQDVFKVLGDFKERLQPRKSNTPSKRIPADNHIRARCIIITAYIGTSVHDQNRNFIIFQQFLYKIQNLSKRLLLKFNRVQLLIRFIIPGRLRSRRQIRCGSTAACSAMTGMPGL